MHFLADTVEKNHPDLVNFTEEILHIEKAARGLYNLPVLFTQELFILFHIVLISPVSEENIQKNIRQMEKSVKQLEIDVKNAQNDKSAPPNDRFVEVMKISFLPNAFCLWCQWWMAVL